MLGMLQSTQNMCRKLSKVNEWVDLMAVLLVGTCGLACLSFWLSLYYPFLLLKKIEEARERKEISFGM